MVQVNIFVNLCQGALRVPAGRNAAVRWAQTTKHFYIVGSRFKESTLVKKTALFIAITVKMSILLYGQQFVQQDIRSIDKDTLKECLSSTIKEYGIPGIAVSIFTDNRVLNNEVVGVRRLHFNDSLRITDRFHLGSCGKAITGYIVGMLVERGIIGWQTKVLNVFPEFADSSLASYKDITLRDLLSHRSGTRPFTENEEWAKLDNFRGLDNRQRRYAFTRWLLRQPPVKMDSVKQYSYSNAGYAVAASVVEKVTGKQWENLIQDELFRHMNIHVAFGWPAQEDENQPWGHWIVEGDSVLRPHSPNDQYRMDEILTPAGNYSMSILDYTRFLQLNLAGVRGNDTIIKSSTYKFLHYCNFDSTKPLVGWYSIGWGVFKTPSGNTISTHDGSAETFYCLAILYKELDFGLVIITNTGDDESVAAIKKLRKRIERYLFR
jgi:D-alanyl-D-alanine carboxypeptidase